MTHDPREARRERTRYLDALPPLDAVFLEAARNAVARAGIPPWEEFRARYGENDSTAQRDDPHPADGPASA